MISYPVQQLKKFRERHNFSRERISRLLNVSSISVFRWEGGISQPSILARKEINKFLKVARQLEEEINK